MFLSFLNPFPTAFRYDPKHRAEILFREYPDIRKAYYLAQHLGLIYRQCKSKENALTRLAHWYESVKKSGIKTFNTVLKSIQSNYYNICTIL